MSVLLVDIGNTRCKWVYVERGQWARQGVVATAELAALETEFATLPAVRRILAAHVAAPALKPVLGELCARWPVAVEWVQARARQCGVTNGYDAPAQLGVDRWAALIAAWQQVGGACLVVNCGTATTVDSLSAQGEFLGGLILPGLDLMAHSLCQQTAQLNAASGTLHDFPRNTADAIASGAIRATLGAIGQQRALLGEKVVCVLSGGAAEKLSRSLPAPVLRVENLVLHGLQRMGEGEPC